jgi:putative transposase
MVARFIAAQRAEHSIPHAVSCRALGISRGWLYKWLRGDTSVRQARRAALEACVGWLFHAHGGRCGSPRIHADLVDLG